VTAPIFHAVADIRFQNIGSEDCEIVGALDSSAYTEALLSDWIAKVPRQLLATT